MTTSNLFRQSSCVFLTASLSLFSSVGQAKAGSSNPENPPAETTETATPPTAEAKASSPAVEPAPAPAPAAPEANNAAPSEPPATGETNSAAPASPPATEGVPAEAPATTDASTTSETPADSANAGNPAQASEATADAAGEATAEGATTDDASGSEELAVDPAMSEAEGPQRPDEPRWGRNLQHPLNGKGMMIAGGTTLGLGVAFLVTSFLVTRCDFDSALECRFQDQREFLVPTAATMTGVGVLALALGVSYHLRYKKWENWSPTQAMVAPMMLRQGGGIAATARF